MFDSRFAQSFIERRVADQDIDAALCKLGRALLILLDHDERFVRAQQVAHQVRTNAA